MKLLNRWTIGRRLGIAFAVGTAITLAVALLAQAALARIGEAMHRVTQDRYAKITQVAGIKDELNKQARYARSAVLFDAGVERDGELKQIVDSRETASALYDRLAPTVRSAEGKRLLAATVERRAAYGEEMARFLALVREGNVAGARAALLQRVRAEQLEYMKALDAFQRLQETLMAGAVDHADAELAASRWLLGLAALAAVLFSAVSGGLLSRSITRPIAEAVRVARTVADGDLTSDVHSDSRDETGDLLRALGVMNRNLVRIVSEVRAGSESIATGSAQIATGNTDLSQRTEEQASNLQQTAASMEQMVATVNRNARTSEQATRITASAAEAAAQGGQAMAQVVHTMQGITADSGRIGDIVGVIDGIAFQTNILALNAAVEAARAGEQGRGFAVVATEVRSLAQRSAAAAREIKALIGGSSEKVRAGAVQVDDAGRAVQAIVAQVRQVNDLMAEIGVASREQTQGLGQVGQAVVQLDQVTQQNAALVEQSAAAADSLSRQAGRLQAVVAAFRVPSTLEADIHPSSGGAHVAPAHT